MMRFTQTYSETGLKQTVLLERQENRIHARFSGDQMIALSIVVILYYALFNGAVFAVFDRFGLPGKAIVDAVLLAVQSLAIAVGVFIALQRKPVLVVCVYIGICTLYLATMLLYPENTPILMNTCKGMFVFCVPAFVLTCALEDKSILYHQLSLGIYPLLLCGLVYYLCAITEEYSMWLGYQMLLPCMLLVLKMLKGRAHLVSFIILLVSMFLMITKGSRGPLLILGLYIVLGFWYYKCRASVQPQLCETDEDGNLIHGKRVYRADMLMLAFFGITAIVLALVNIQTLSGWLYNFMLERGIAVRTLRLISSDNGLFYTSGRDLITECALQAIARRPILGYGLGGDCVYIGREVYNTTPAGSGGAYAHNLVLELCMHYGIVAGVALFVAFVRVVVRKWRTLSAESSQKDLLIVAVVYGFLQSMITGTYLTNSVLWLLLGLAISNTHNSPVSTEGEE